MSYFLHLLSGASSLRGQRLRSSWLIGTVAMAIIFRLLTSIWHPSRSGNFMLVAASGRMLADDSILTQIGGDIPPPFTNGYICGMDINGDASCVLQAYCLSDNGSYAGHAIVYCRNDGTASPVDGDGGSWEVKGGLDDMRISGSNSENYWAVAISSDGSRVAAGNWNGPWVDIYDYIAGSWTRTERLTIAGGRFGVALDLDGSGTKLVVGDYHSNSYYVYELLDAGWTKVHENSSSASRYAETVAMKEDGSAFAVVKRDDPLQVELIEWMPTSTSNWPSTSFSSLSQPSSGDIRDISFSEDGTKIVLAVDDFERGGDDKVEVHEIDGFNYVGPFSNGVVNLGSGADLTRGLTALNRDGTLLAIGEPDIPSGPGTVWLFEFNDASGEYDNIATKVGEMGERLGAGVELSPDGSTVIANTALRDGRGGYVKGFEVDLGTTAEESSEKEMCTDTVVTAGGFVRDITIYENSGPQMDGGNLMVVDLDDAATGGEARALLKFDSLLPRNARLIRATLYLSSLMTEGEVKGHRMLTAWDENDASWDITNGAPWEAGASFELTRKTDSVSVDSVSIDVTADVEAWHRGMAMNNGWILIASSNNERHFFTSKSRQQHMPRLEMEYCDVCQILKDEILHLDDPRNKCRDFQAAGCSAVDLGIEDLCSTSPFSRVMRFGGLNVAFTSVFQWRWDDRGSEGRDDGSFFHPYCPMGFFPLGSVAKSDYNGIDGSVTAMCFQNADNTGVLALPLGWQKVWDDRGSGADEDGSCWRADCPLGYVTLGDVFVTGFDEPQLFDIACVRHDWTNLGLIGKVPEWTDRDTASMTDFSAWQVESSPLSTTTPPPKILRTTFTAVDNNIREANPDQPGGMKKDMSVDLFDDDGLRSEALLKFEDLKIPEGSRLKSAFLTLYTNSASDGTVYAYRMVQAWDDNSTWNSFGSNGVSPNGAEAVVSASFMIEQPLDKRLEQYDVTKDVEFWLANPEKNQGWVLLIDSDDGWDFDSAESNDVGSRPMLQLELEPWNGGIAINTFVGVQSYDKPDDSLAINMWLPLGKAKLCSGVDKEDCNLCPILKEEILLLEDRRDKCLAFEEAGCSTFDLDDELCPPPFPVASSELAPTTPVCDIKPSDPSDTPFDTVISMKLGTDGMYYAVGEIDGMIKLIIMDIVVRIFTQDETAQCSLDVIQECSLPGKSVEAVAVAEPDGGIPQVYIAGQDKADGSPFISLVTPPTSTETEECDVVANGIDFALPPDGEKDKSLPFFNGLTTGPILRDVLWSATKTSIFRPDESKSSLGEFQYHLTPFKLGSGTAVDGEYLYFAETSVPKDESDSFVLLNNRLVDVVALDDYGSFLTMESGFVVEKGVPTMAPTTPPTQSPSEPFEFEQAPFAYEFGSSLSMSMSLSMFTGNGEETQIPINPIPSPLEAEYVSTAGPRTCFYRTYVEELFAQVGVARKDLIECVAKEYTAVALGAAEVSDRFEMSRRSLRGQHPLRRWLSDADKPDFCMQNNEGKLLLIKDANEAGEFLTRRILYVRNHLYTCRDCTTKLLEDVKGVVDEEELQRNANAIKIETLAMEAFQNTESFRVTRKKATAKCGLVIGNMNDLDEALGECNGGRCEIGGKSLDDWQTRGTTINFCCAAYNHKVNKRNNKNKN